MRKIIVHFQFEYKFHLNTVLFLKCNNEIFRESYDLVAEPTFDSNFIFVTTRARLH